MRRKSILGFDRRLSRIEGKCFTTVLRWLRALKWYCFRIIVKVVIQFKSFYVYLLSAIFYVESKTIILYKVLLLDGVSLRALY